MNQEFCIQIKSQVKILSNNAGHSCEVSVQKNASYFVTMPKLNSINQAAIDQLSCS